MKYIINAKQAKMLDQLTTDYYGIPSLVLMERAALGVAEYIDKFYAGDIRIISVCGKGNNGADGMAAARILYEKGYDVTVLDMGCETKEGQQQLFILKKCGIKVKKYTRNKVKFDEYNLIIDAIFGIGLSRNVDENCGKLIQDMNAAKAAVLSVDIPSGINASTGQIMGAAVKSDVTVTFGLKKMGMLLYPGAQYCGKIKTVEIGFASKAINRIKNKAFMYTKKDLKRIPKRNKNSHKGMFGKVLVVAGSELMGGAASLAGLSAYRSGCGLVKIFTHANNRNAILKTVPEVLLSTYESSMSMENVTESLRKDLEWANCVILGPGLSKDKFAVEITKYVLAHTKVSTIVDADAINIIAKFSKSDEELHFSSDEHASFILTPHIGEMERISGYSKDLIVSDPMRCIQLFLKEFGGKFEIKNLICVMKSARTLIGSRKGELCINCTGNSGMAKGGSGDVLTGIIAGLLVNGMQEFEAVSMAVFVHGLAGDKGAVKYGEYGMKAGDIIENLPSFLKS